MSEPPSTPLLIQTVVIVGVGLIGGSLAAALKSRKVASRVIGVGRDASRIEAARDSGLIDEATTDIATVIQDADLVVFCTPVDCVAKDMRRAEAALIAGHRRSGAAQGHPSLFTDVGSVKSPICDELADLPHFVGSHPIAGSHRQGFEAADPRLFEGRMCVITPLASSPASQVKRLEQFWQSIGMRTTQMSPSAHDRSLAMTSHLPHIVAASLASTLTAENRSLTGSGFRDTTRVAAGDPGLWTGILMNNADAVLEGIDAIQQKLSRYREALATRHSDVILGLLKEGQLSRTTLDKTLQSLD